MRGAFEKRFKERTREGWKRIFIGTDVCVTPVLTMRELENAGFDQRPVVRLTESPGLTTGESKEAYCGQSLRPGEGAEEVLREWMGWEKGRDWDVDRKGAWFVKDRGKL